MKKELFKQNEKFLEKTIKPDWGDFIKNPKFQMNLYYFFGVKPDKKFNQKSQIQNINQINCMNELYGSNLYLNTYKFPL